MPLIARYFPSLSPLPFTKTRLILFFDRWQAHQDIGELTKKMLKMWPKQHNHNQFNHSGK